MQLYKPTVKKKLSLVLCPVQGQSYIQIDNIFRRIYLNDPLACIMSKDEILKHRPAEFDRSDAL